MTLAEAREIHNSKGGHFFDRDTMRFFGSRIESPLYKNRCFVTSEDNFDCTRRFYTVRQFSEDYEDVTTYGKFNSIVTKAEAIEIAKGVPV